mgnify:CR=1 FL=1
MSEASEFATQVCVSDQPIRMQAKCGGISSHVKHIGGTYRGHVLGNLHGRGQGGVYGMKRIKNGSWGEKNSLRNFDKGPSMGEMGQC